MKYVLVFSLLILAIIVVAWILANYLAKAQYMSEFANLKGDVTYAIINYDNYKLIRQKFENLNRYRCKDEKKIVELRAAFDDRFEVIFTPEEDAEFSPKVFDFQNLQRQANINKILNEKETK